MDAYSNLELISNDQIFDLVKMSLEIFPDNYQQYQEYIDQINKSLIIQNLSIILTDYILMIILDLHIRN